MNDDEIRRQLTVMVPEHRDGFWDDLRRGLLVTPSSGVPQVGPPAPGVLLDPGTPLPGTFSGPDQPVPVALPAARAGSAAPSRPSRPRGPAPRWAAAAAAVFLAGSGLVAWQGTLGRLSPTSWWGGSAAGSRSPRLPESSPAPTVTVASGSAGAEGSATASPPAGATVGGSGSGTGTGSLPHLTTVLPVDAAQVATTVLGQVARLAPAAAGQWLRAGRIDPVGTPLAAISWVDRQGRNVLLITRTATGGATGDVTMRAYLGARLGRTTHLVSTLSQQGAGLRLAGGLPSVADADGDGNAEAGVGWLLPSTGSTTSLLGVVAVFTEGHEYVLRGSRSIVTTAGKVVGGVASQAAGAVSGAQGAVSGAVSGAGSAVPSAALPGGVGVPPAPTAPSPLPEATSAASGVGDTVTRVVVSVLGAVPAAGAWPTGLYDRAHQELQHLLG
jgi:hypothetical protein